MKSLKYTIPILIIISIFWRIPIIHADILPITDNSSIDFTYEYNSEKNITKEINIDQIITDAPSYWGAINDTYLNRQWPLIKMSIPALNYFEKQVPILVAVLDTGIDKNHEDLRGKVIAEVNFSESSSSDDFNGHGTFIAGIIAANIDNGIGIAGISPNCSLLNVKVIDDEGYCKGTDIAQGIVWATDHGAKVINVSIEYNTGFHRLEEAVNYAWDNGALVISAASNQVITPVYPAQSWLPIKVIPRDLLQVTGIGLMLLLQD